MEQLRQRLLKLGVGLFVGVLFTEVVLWNFPRSLLPQEFRLLDRVYTARGAWQEMMQGDPYVGYKLRPNVNLQFPSEGRKLEWKTTDHGLGGDTGFRDIGTRPPFYGIAIGDSYSICDDASSEACWVRQISDSTGLSMGTLGVNGYSNLAAVRVLERYGRPLKPKLVMFGIFPNDFRDNVNFHKWSESGSTDFWVWQGQQRGRGTFGRWISDYSMIYRIFDGATRARGKKIFKHTDEHFDYVFRFERWWTDLLGPGRAEQHDGWKLVQQSILDTQKHAREVGAHTMIIALPAKEQIHWNIAKQYAPKRIRDLSQADVDHPVKMIGAFCESHGIPYCEFSDALRAEALQGKQFYHRINTHWNDDGNRIGARFIEQCLRQYNLVSPQVAVVQ